MSYPTYDPSLFGPEDQTLHTVFLSRYISLAGYSVLLLDLIITLPHEMSVVWPARWSIVKILFLITRYSVPPVITANIVGILGLTTSLTTTGMARLMAYYQLTALALFNVIVSLRLHALYGRRRDVFWALAVLLAFTYSAAIALASHFFGNVVFPTVAYTDVPNFDMCFATKWQGVWAVWVPATIYETILWGMTAYKTWQHWHVGRVPLRVALAGDGFLYHSCVLAVRILSVLTFGLSQSPSLMLFVVNFAFSIITTAASRMMLYLPSVQGMERWSQEQDTFRESGECSEWAISPDLALRARPKVNLWLADQGGRSFLEQVYQTTVDAETPEKPTLLYMDKFIVGHTRK
ncbi:hypothetical protein DACRYDRAFT_106615 [Dacryopinax primogenitus]|uniref:DUF6533 domain-containing protein n=1 Tax=Dacryopinax primogenitus (strain DJM 731) TaxID=1858805 RepID=M5G1D9_DACPD|nr:uncharacterized protein DACRYDRAFT_106615 [Dacryopinax primogenitus]EJU02544.1 hypothetical protein DACRYDRAFT_106615 [Dacryopinax primogenitus]